jgi:hypothetical protein
LLSAWSFIKLVVVRMLSSYLAAIGDGDVALKASVSAHAFKCHTRCAEYFLFFMSLLFFCQHHTAEFSL